MGKNYINVDDIEPRKIKDRPEKLTVSTRNIVPTRRQVSRKDVDKFVKRYTKHLEDSKKQIDESKKMVPPKNDDALDVIPPVNKGGRPRKVKTEED